MTLILLLCVSLHAAARQTETPSPLSAWPAGASPQEIGRLVADRFASSPFGGYDRLYSPGPIHYAEVCTWYGALTFARASHDTLLRNRLIARFDNLLGHSNALIPVPDHVDHTVFSIVPFEISIESTRRDCLDLATDMADAQWRKPVGASAGNESNEYIARGYSSQTRMWVDDMYMITSVQTQAYRATGRRLYIERAAKEMVMYLDSLQRPNGLFYHAPDVPLFWGRGNGWVAAGMTELLLSLPEDSPYRGRIMRAYRAMMQELLKDQDESGMWHQLVDHPESWLESSCTGMFTFALITGVRNGWLEASTYGVGARRGWMGMVKCIDEKGDIRNVCEGTGKKNDVQYYLDRKRRVGDLHGQAPVLWCATALLR